LRNRAVWLPLRAVGASAHYTELPGVNHNARDPVYNDAEMDEWLLTQLRR
jgi:predicted peptidase